MNVIISNKYQSLLATLNIDVIKSINGVFTVEELVAQFSNFFYNKLIIDITAIKNYEDINTMQELSVNLDMSKSILLLDDNPIVNSPMYISQLISMGIYNFTNDAYNIRYLIDNPNSYKDVASYHNINGFKKPSLNEFKEDFTVGKIGQKILGIKNVTDHAGATTLTYLMKIHLESMYKVKAVEIDKNDFEYFNDDELDSISSISFSEYLTNNSDLDVILVDLNDSSIGQYCTDVIYLIEPGIIQLNRLVNKNSNIFDELMDKKVVVNKSVLNDKDLQDFERECGIMTFFNIPYLDDKQTDINVISALLEALGFSRIDSSNSGKLFTVFK